MGASARVHQYYNLQIFAQLEFTTSATCVCVTQVEHYLNFFVINLYLQK